MSELVKLAATFGPAVQSAMQEQGALLVAQTHGFMIEEANTKLHSRRAMFVDHLSHFQLDDDTFVINLEAKYAWIDSGLPAGSMLDDLLKSKSAKRAKDGSTYVVIPFQQNKAPTATPFAQQSLTDTLKRVMKQKGIPYGKLEMDGAGKPKLGFLHRFDIKDMPLKTQGPWGGNSQGKGPVGAPMQGPTGIPFLKGINIYQREHIDEAGNKSVKKDIVTFRIASNKHYSQGRWERPEMQGVHIFESAEKWACDQWDNEIVPTIISMVIAKV